MLLVPIIDDPFVDFVNFQSVREGGVVIHKNPELLELLLCDEYGKCPQRLVLHLLSFYCLGSVGCFNFLGCLHSLRCFGCLCCLGCIGRLN